MWGWALSCLTTTPPPPPPPPAKEKNKIKHVLAYKGYIEIIFCLLWGSWANSSRVGVGLYFNSVGESLVGGFYLAATTNYTYTYT